MNGLAMNQLRSQFFTFESHDFQRNQVNPMNRNHFQFNQVKGLFVK